MQSWDGWLHGRQRPRGKERPLLTVQLQTPKQTTAITIWAATVQWTLELEFGVEFLEMQELERARLEQFLVTQVNIAA